jgi:hypothetical protein
VSVEIGLRWVRASLCGYGGEAPSGAAFFDVLALEPEWATRARPSESAWQSANIELFAVAMADLQAYREPFEEFAARVERGFLHAAAWLDARPPGAFDRWRSQGRKADIFIGGWLANEQFDLVLPAPFLLACGRADLPIRICTNDCGRERPDKSSAPETTYMKSRKVQLRV